MEYRIDMEELYVEIVTILKGNINITQNNPNKHMF